MLASLQNCVAIEVSISRNLISNNIIEISASCATIDNNIIEIYFSCNNNNFTDKNLTNNKIVLS